MPQILIKPPRKWELPDLKELVSARELIYFLTWRDIKVRYKQTFLGAAWAILQPLLLMAAFALFFGRLIGVKSDGVPYHLFALAALIPWTFFATTLSHAANSLVANPQLITKVYLPRLALPISSMLAGLVDFGLGLLTLFFFLFFAGETPQMRMLNVLPLMIIVSITTLGMGILLASINVRFRDVRYAVPFLIQVWLFATPIAYSSSIVPEAWRPLYALNPLVGVIDGFRWALLDTPLYAPSLVISAGVSLVVLTVGLLNFTRTERSFADMV